MPTKEHGRLTDRPKFGWWPIVNELISALRDAYALTYSGKLTLDAHLNNVQRKVFTTEQYSRLPMYERGTLQGYNKALFDILNSFDHHTSYTYIPNLGWSRSKWDSMTAQAKDYVMAHPSTDTLTVYFWNGTNCPFSAHGCGHMVLVAVGDPIPAFELSEVKPAVGSVTQPKGKG